jgi:endoglucanase
MSCSCSPKKQELKGFHIQRGINISHWLSQVYDEEPTRIRYFTELDAIFLKEAGFDHIRLPIDEERLWHEDGRPNTKSFTELQRAIDWCEQVGLRVIVDLHVIRSYHFNADFDGKKNTLFTDQKAKEHFKELWRQLSEELSRHPTDLVAYEILNEVSAPTPADWNKLLQETISMIRKQEPAETFKDLTIPENDPNLILSFHLYSPLPVTHYRAIWSPLYEYEGEIRYPGVPVPESEFSKPYPEETLTALRTHQRHYDAKTQAARINLALNVAEKHNLPLYCGEFGCLSTVPRDIRMKWYQDAVHIMEAKGIAYAAWDYKGNFNIVDRDSHLVDWELIHILTDQN